jgi:hypothetical protein
MQWARRRQATWARHRQCWRDLRAERRLFRPSTASTPPAPPPAPYAGDAAINNSGSIYAGVLAATIETASSIYATGAFAYSHDYDGIVKQPGGWQHRRYAGVYGYNASTPWVPTRKATTAKPWSSTRRHSATAYGYGYFHGVNATGAYAFSETVTRSSPTRARSTATGQNAYDVYSYYGAYATGIEAFSVFGDTQVTNSGTVTATSYTAYGNSRAGQATGIDARVPTTAITYVRNDPLRRRDRGRQRRLRHTFLVDATRHRRAVFHGDVITSTTAAR